MSKFRFTAEMFIVEVHSPYVRIETAAKIANAFLEAEEKKCEMVYGHLPPPDGGDGIENWARTRMNYNYEYTALLWNVEKINE